MKLRKKIELRMQILEEMMKRNMHIEDPETVDLFLDRITYCWGVLSEEDRDLFMVASMLWKRKLSGVYNQTYLITTLMKKTERVFFELYS